MSRNSNDKNLKSQLGQQTQRRHPGLLVENPNDFRSLYSSSHARLSARRYDESEDGYSSGGSSDDDDEAMFLGGAAIRSSQSMMKSSSKDQNNKTKTTELDLQDSLMYSEDEGTSVQNESKSCLDLSSCSESSAVFPNSRTLHSGTFLEEVLKQAQRSSSSNSSSFDSEESSLFGRQDHYFSPDGFSDVFLGENVCGRGSISTGDQDEPPRIGSASNSRCSSLEGKLNNRSVEGDFFIFSDDDGSTESRTKTSTDQQQSGNFLSGNGAFQDFLISDNPLQDESYNLFVASIQASHKRKDLRRSTETKTAADDRNYAFDSPEKSGHLNRELGRLMPRQMPKQAAQDSSPSPTEGTGETASLSSDSASPCSPQHAKSLFGRVFGGRRWTRSPSPLDNVVEILNHDGLATNDDTDAFHFKIDSAHRVSDLAIASLFGSSAKRNLLVDFAAWEAAVSRDVDDKKEARLNSTCSVIEEGSDEEDNEEKPVFFIKAVSLLAQDFVDSIARPSPSKHQKLAIDVRDGLFEPRIATEDIATALDVSDEGRQLLTHIRGRAGVIDDPEQSLEYETNGSGQLPWIHLHDNVWMPHYEEYVVRSVYRFQRQLQRSMAAAMAPPFSESGTASTSDRSSDHDNN